MRFSLESKPFENAGAFGRAEKIERYIIHADENELEVVAGYGAALNGWRVSEGGKTHELLYGYRDNRMFWEVHQDLNAGACLSPFPGRTNNAVWEWKGETYRLLNNVSWSLHAVHGFLFDDDWVMKSFTTEEKSAELVLEYTFKGDEGFPFPYRITNIYTFFGTSFTVKSIVENTGTETLPYAQGFHPYFMLGCKRKDLTITLPKCHRALVNFADIPTGNFEPEERFTGTSTLGKTEINDYFSFDTASNERETISLQSQKTGERIDVWQKTGKGLYRGVQLYTPPNAEAIAVEPMTSAPDVLNHHRELIEISPEKSVELLWGADFSTF